MPLTFSDATGTELAPNPALAFPGQMKTLPDLWYNRHRDYDPTTGRYLQADPIGLAGDANPFAYAKGNSLKYTDPSGQIVPAAVAIGIATAVVIELVIQAVDNWGKGNDVFDANCYEWGEVAFAGALGAFGGNWARSAVKMGRGSMKWNNASRRARRAEGLVGKGVDLHHWAISRRFGDGVGGVRDRIVNSPWNLHPVSREAHRALHGTDVGTASSLWQGAPAAVRGGAISGAGGAVIEGSDGKLDD